MSVIRMFHQLTSASVRLSFQLRTIPNGPSSLATNDSSGSKYFVRLRAADNGLLGPIAVLIVPIRVLGLVVRRAVHLGLVPVRSSRT